MFRFFEDEASAAHELIAKLLATPVGDVFSGNNEAFSRRDVISDLVHFSIDDPPLGFVLGAFIEQGGGAQFGPPTAGRGRRLGTGSNIPECEANRRLEQLGRPENRSP